MRGRDRPGSRRRARHGPSAGRGTRMRRSTWSTLVAAPRFGRSRPASAAGATRVRGDLPAFPCPWTRRAMQVPTTRRSARRLAPAARPADRAALWCGDRGAGSRRRRDRPCARPARHREALHRPAVHGDLQWRAGHRDPPGHRVRLRRGAGADRRSSGWPTSCRDAGPALRACRKGAIEVGNDADLVLFDPFAERTIRAGGLHHTSDYTPYEGIEVSGAIRQVLSRGRVIIRDGAWLGARGHGRYLDRRLD